jgi:hypothetical protein
MRGLVCLLLLASSSCSASESQAPKEEQAAAAKPQSQDTGFVATNTSEELAFLASRICLTQIQENRGTAGDYLENLLTDHGYRMVSVETSRELFGEVVPGFVAARKESKFGQFKVAFGGRLPGCVTLLTDNSKVPPVKQLRATFESQGWEWAYAGAPAGERLPYAAFQAEGKNGKTVAAMLEDEPESDRNVRLAIIVNHLAS